MKTFEEFVGEQEGLSLKPYKDSQGVWTIGYGRNLDDFGISKEEADLLRANDCNRARLEAESFWWFPSLDEVRQTVVLLMLFQLGMTRFLGFKRMITALRTRDFKNAAAEMRDSLWAKQTKERAEMLAHWMETGACP